MTSGLSSAAVAVNQNRHGDPSHSPGSRATTEQVAAFNAAEALFWFGVAGTVLRPGFQAEIPYFRWNVPLAITFMVFGLCDLWEIRSGAWWRPWQLAALKIVCGIAIGLSFTRLLAAQRRKRAASTVTTPGT